MPQVTASRSSAWIASAIWLVLVVTCFGLVIRYSLTPGRAGQSPANWPATSLPRATNMPTLVMAVHPHCPCTRASLAELANIMTQCRGRLAARVVFVCPPGFTAAWSQTELWRTAQAIPGVIAVVDSSGVEAKRFGAFTSGQVAVYDTQGRLSFSGGITGARGHLGSNAGEAAVIEMVEHGNEHPRQSAVFGCPLERDADGSKSDKECQSCPDP